MFVPVGTAELPDPVLLIGTGVTIPPDYRGTSYSASLVSLIVARVQRGASLEDFSGAELTQDEIDAFERLRVSPGGAASWVRFGFTAETAAEWKQVRVRLAASAAYLVELGVTPEDYTYYSGLRRAGTQSRNGVEEAMTAVTRWKRSFPEVTDLREAFRWHSTGLSPNGIRSLVHSGFTADQALSVIRRFEIGTVDGIRYVLTKEGTASFDATLLPWVEDGWVPGRAEVLRATGKTPSEVDTIDRSTSIAVLREIVRKDLLDYVVHRWGLQTAERLKAEGVDEPTATRIRSAGVHDFDLLLSVARGETPLEWAASFDAGAVESDDDRLAFFTYA